MKTFTDRWQQLDWDDIRLRINSKTSADVERALNAHPSRDDMMALLSPAASAYLEPLAQRAQTLTRQRFGNTVSFYVPLYLSNLCANDCTYCGFSMSNRIKRKTLNETDIIRECAAIRELGFEHLLLVTGEHQAKVGMDYFRRHFAHHSPAVFVITDGSSTVSRGGICRTENAGTRRRDGLSGNVSRRDVRAAPSEGEKTGFLLAAGKPRTDWGAPVSTKSASGR